MCLWVGDVRQTPTMVQSVVGCEPSKEDVRDVSDMNALQTPTLGPTPDVYFRKSPVCGDPVIKYDYDVKWDDWSKDLVQSLDLWVSNLTGTSPHPLSSVFASLILSKFKSRVMTLCRSLLPVGN